jgi:hypothetical protein
MVIATLWLQGKATVLLAIASKRDLAYHKSFVKGEQLPP